MRCKILTLQIVCYVLILVFASTIASAAQITLKNGDVIIGEIKQEEIPFQAKVGKLNIKCEILAYYEDGKLQLRDGTTLAGVFAEETLKVSTSWGGIISVETQDITKISQESPEVSKETPKVEPKPDLYTPPTVM